MRKPILVLLFLLIKMSSVSAQAVQTVRVNDIAWSPDDRLLAVATTNGVIVYDTSIEGKPRLWSADISQWANVVIFSPSGQWVVVGTQGPLSETRAGMVYIWNSHTGELLRSFEGNESGVYALTFNLDGTRLAVGGGEWWIPIYGYVKVWNFGDDAEISSLRINGHGGIIHAMTYSPDGRWFVYSSEYGAITFLDVATWTPVTAIYETTDQIQFDPSENPSTHVWLGHERAEEWEIRDSPETYLVQTDQKQLGPNIALPSSNDAEIIGSTVEHYVSATNDGVLRVGTFDDGGNIFMHVDDGQRFRKMVLNSTETEAALISEVNVGNLQPNPYPDQVSVWTFASGEYHMLDLSD